MLIGYNKRFWGEAINLAVYLKNRLAHKRVKDQTPYEAYHGKKPMVHHLQPFGRKCVIHIPVEQRNPGTKLNPRGLEGIFTGHTSSTHIYRIWIPSAKRLIETRQLTWEPLNLGEASSITEPTTLDTIQLSDDESEASNDDTHNLHHQPSPSAEESEPESPPTEEPEDDPNPSKPKPKPVAP